MTTQEERQLISREETARILGVTVRTIRRWVDTERLTQHRDPVNGRVWYDLKEVQALRNG